MRKNTAFSLSCFFLLALGIAAYGKASYNGDHIYFYNQYGYPYPYETINDWHKQGTAGYSQFFQLSSETDCLEDAVSEAGPKTRLQWDFPETKHVPSGAWSGYRWYVPEGITQNIIQVYTCGWYALPPDSELRLLSDKGDILWTWDYTDGTWINTITPVFEPTEWIEFVVYQKTSGYIWEGNGVWLYFMQMTTRDLPVYFGYYWTVWSDYPQSYSFPQVRNFTNLNHVRLSSWSKNDIEGFARESCAWGVNWLLDVRWEFSPDKFTGDMLTNPVAWDVLADKIDEQDTQSVLAAFYFDEPIWNGLTSEQLKVAVNTIKNRFPGKKVMINLAYVTIDTMDFGTLPSNAEWIAFNYYGEVYGPMPSVKGYKNKLKGFMSSTQKLFLYMAASTEPLPYVYTDTQLASMSYQYYDLANSDPVVLGILGFRCPNVVSLPLTFEVQSDMGNRIRYGTRFR